MGVIPELFRDLVDDGDLAFVQVKSSRRILRDFGGHCPGKETGVPPFLVLISRIISGEVA
jgi:hypothetical protein